MRQQIVHVECVRLLGWRWVARGRALAFALMCAGSAVYAAEAYELQRAADVGGQRPASALGFSMVLFDQFDAASGNGTPDQDFETALDAFDALAADDFVVSVDVAWNVREVRTIGTTTVAGGATISVAVHHNAPGGGNPDLPGTAVAGCSHSGVTPTSDTAGSFVIRFPEACLLTAGSYWLVMQTRQDVATHGQHFWSNRAVQTGSEAVWRNPENGFGSGCTAFRPQTQCGVGGGASPDLLFQIVGELAGADLAVTIADAPDPVIAGQTLQYSVEVRNLGPAPARDIELLLEMQPGISPQAVSASHGGSCTPVADSVRCRWIGLTAPGTTLAATAAAEIPAASLHGSNVRADASASALSNDPEAGNDTAAALTSVLTVADLQLAQASAEPQTVIAGTNLLLAAIVSNDGPSDARDVSVAMTLPAELVLLSLQANGAMCATGAVLTCQWPGATASGGTRTVQVVTQVRPSVSAGTLQVPMGAYSATFDPDAAGNSTVVSTEVLTRADLSLALAASPDPVLAGQVWVIAAEIANAGPSDARDVRVVLALPSGISVAQVDPGTGGACVVTTEVVCVWPGITDVANSRRVVAEFMVGAAIAAGTQLSSVVTVAAQTGDDNDANNSATARSSVQTSADLQISLQAMPSALAVGAMAELRALAHNLGPSAAQALEVEIRLGADLRFAGVDADGADCLLPQTGLGGTVRCRWSGATSPQSSRELRVRASGGSDGEANVTAATTSVTADADFSNNRAATSVAIGVGVLGIPVLGATAKLVLCLLLVGIAIRWERR